MFIATVVYEHADSPYMAFAWPGLIGWMVAAVWWFRNRDRFLPLTVQVVCAFEIVVGVFAARAYGVLEAEDMFISSSENWWQVRQARWMLSRGLRTQWSETLVAPSRM